MPLVTSKQILKDARNGRYAVGAFNANNLELVQAVIEAAEEERSPVIVMISMGAIAYAGLHCLSGVVKSTAEAASVPVVLFLDHGTTYEVNMDCLRAGFTGLMFDGSSQPLESNIAVSSRIAEKAHAAGIPLEAELGRIPRIEEYESLLPAGYDYTTKLPAQVQEKVAALMADPEQAAEFVERSGCDSLAVAIGSVHGMKRDVQPLNIERLKKLAECTGIPLVLHGASGVIRTREDAAKNGIQIEPHEGTLEDAIRHGISKVNVGTEISLSFIRGIKSALEKDPRQKDVRKILLPGKQRVKDAVRGYMRLFGCSGKAGGSQGSSSLHESTIQHAE